MMWVWLRLKPGRRVRGLHARIERRFARSEPRERMLAYVRGLLAPLEKKNSWTLSERAGEAVQDEPCGRIDPSSAQSIVAGGRVRSVVDVVGNAARYRGVIAP